MRLLTSLRRALPVAGCAAVLATFGLLSPQAANSAGLPRPLRSAVAAPEATAVAVEQRQRGRRSTRRPRTRRTRTVAAARYAPAWSSPRGTEALAAGLGSILDRSTRGGGWGVLVVSLTRGDTLFARNPDAMMQPASTLKMYSASVALDRFGPDHSFKTTVFRDDRLENGVVQGNLYLKGDGDPSLGSPRFWRGEQPMDVLARQIAANGVRHVRGDIVADAGAFDDEAIPAGWKTSYLGAAYAARVSALSLNENLVWVVARPEGGKAVVELEPASTTIPVTSTVRLVGGRGGSIRAVRQPDGSLRVSGAIGRSSPPRKWSLVVDDPPRFAGGALEAALRKAGVQVDGGVRLGPTPASAVSVAAVASPPLSHIVAEMNRESINLFAELLFRDAARADAPNGVGTAASGLAHLRQFLTQKVGGVRSEAVNVADGSGLSTLDAVTPRSMIHLLGYAHKADWGPVFHASLPIVGESGTLRRQGRNTPARGNLHAKTGTTNTVASLGGYVTAKNGEVIAFSFIYNGNDRAMAKGTMNSMGATLAEWVR